MKRSQIEAGTRNSDPAEWQSLTFLFVDYLSRSFNSAAPTGNRTYLDASQSMLESYSGEDLDNPNTLVNLCMTLDNLPEPLKTGTSHIMEAVLQMIQAKCSVTFDVGDGTLFVSAFELTTVPEEHRKLLKVLFTLPSDRLTPIEVIAQKVLGKERLTFSEKNGITHDLALLKNYLKTVTMPPHSAAALQVLRLEDGPIAIEKDGKNVDTWGFSLQSDIPGK